MADVPSAPVFDHLAVAATTLGQGIDYIEQKLGVRMPAGGKHPRMSTHNAVMALGPDIYIEVIAIDPEAPPPEQPRWFGLDDPAIADDLASNGPRLLTWIARCGNLDAILARADGTFDPGSDLGRPLAMSRGDLRWRFAVRPDGGLNAGGLLPYLIEWSGDQKHPAAGMADLGVRLVKLRLHSPETDRLAQQFALIGMANPPEIVASSGLGRLEAVFQSPKGEATL